MKETTRPSYPSNKISCHMPKDLRGTYNKLDKYIIQESPTN